MNMNLICNGCTCGKGNLSNFTYDKNSHNNKDLLYSNRIPDKISSTVIHVNPKPSHIIHKRE